MRSHSRQRQDEFYLTNQMLFEGLIHDTFAIFDLETYEKRPKKRIALSK